MPLSMCVSCPAVPCCVSFPMHLSAAKETKLNVICCHDNCVCAHMQKESLVSMAEWCRRYAQINSVGLRKVPAHADLYVP